MGCKGQMCVRVPTVAPMPSCVSLGTKATRRVQLLGRLTFQHMSPETHVCAFPVGCFQFNTCKVPALDIASHLQHSIQEPVRIPSVANAATNQHQPQSKQLTGNRNNIATLQQHPQPAAIKAINGQPQ